MRNGGIVNPQSLPAVGESPLHVAMVLENVRCRSPLVAGMKYLHE